MAPTDVGDDMLSLRRGRERPTTTAARVAVVRALPGVGDLLCCVPALRALRAGLPSASEITLVGLSGAQWFVDRFPHYVDDLLVCPVWPGLPEIDGPAQATAPFVAAARRRRFDLAIQMHGDGRVSNDLTAALGSARWVGLGTSRRRQVDERGRVGEYRPDRHEIDRCLDALTVLGVPHGDPQLEFPVSADEVATAAAIAGDCSFAIVHPGASTASRRWSPFGFGRVVDHLLDHVDRVVLTGGQDERLVTTAVASIVSRRHHVIDTAGATTIGHVGALCRKAAVVVANDTGVAHLAAATGAPIVTVCGPSDRARWAPRAPLARIVGGHPPGRWPTVHEVRAAVDELLDVGGVP